MHRSPVTLINNGGRLSDVAFLRLFDAVLERLSDANVELAYGVLTTLTLTVLASAISCDNSDVPKLEEISKAAQSLANDFARIAREPSGMQEVMRQLPALPALSTIN
jgi:hypothetical protein